MLDSLRPMLSKTKNAKPAKPPITTAVGRLPWLPNELVNQVFIVAARSSKDSAAALTLVSRATRGLVRPILFGSLIMEHRATNFAFIEMLGACPDIPLMVKSLWMRECVPKDVGLLVMCRHLQRLAITPQAFSALLRFGNSLEQYGRGSSGLLQPRQLLLFPGALNHDCQTLQTTPYSYTLFSNMTHLYLSQASQFSQLLAVSAPFDSLTHLATPLAGISLSTEDIIGSSRFPVLRRILVLHPGRDPGMTPYCQFLATQWVAETMIKKAYNYTRVRFLERSPDWGTRLLEAWKSDWGCLWE